VKAALEREAVEAAARGDSEPLARMLEGYRPRLERFVALRLDPVLRRRIDPDDVLQEALAEVLRRVGDVLERPDRDLFGWARFLTGQRLIQEKRKHLGAAQRDAGRERPGLPEASSVAIASAFLDGGPTPSQEAVRGEHQQRLAEALEELEPDDREVLVMRHFEGLGNGEVAALLELTESAASMRYARALGRLRRTLRALGLESREATSG